MDQSETLGIGEMDDINLPLDEIIQRKEQRERGAGGLRSVQRGGPRRAGPPSQRPFGRFPRPELTPTQLGTGVFHGDAQTRVPWRGYEEAYPFPAPPAPPVEFDNGQQYWTQHPQVYPQPPPPPVRQEGVFRGYRSRPHHHHVKQPASNQNVRMDRGMQEGPSRGGIRKPVLDRRRGRGYGRRRPALRSPVDIPETPEKPELKEDKCTMIFDKGNAVIKFNDIEILKVSAQGDLILTTEGHQDGRFLKALNDVLGLINVEILAEEDRPESWKVKDGFSLFRYYDGIVIKGKGEPSKNRAESIKKAFEQPNPKALEATLASNLAARRLGLSFDPMSPPVAPGSSIRITQDQQLTRTSNYSISFVEQNKEQKEEVIHPSPVFHPQGPVASGFPPY